MSLKEAVQARREAKAAVAVIPEVKFGANYRTSQIYSRGYEFAFMARQENGSEASPQGIWTQACTFVFCKDFLHDAVWGAVNKKPWQVHGFKYDPSKDLPLDMGYCAMAFRNTLFKDKPAEFHAKREACQKFLNGIEAKLGFQPSQIFEVAHPESPCWLILGDKNWQLAAPLVGFFTLFIRLGIAHNPDITVEATLEQAKEGKITIGDDQGRGYAGSNDSTYIQQAWRGLELLFQHGIKIFHPTIEENYPEDLPKRGASLHDHFGPVNFSGKQAAKAMPFWYREEIWGK